VDLFLIGRKRDPRTNTKLLLASFCSWAYQKAVKSAVAVAANFSLLCDLGVSALSA
jgi:hypothetical protein